MQQPQQLAKGKTKVKPETPRRMRHPENVAFSGEWRAQGDDFRTCLYDFVASLTHVESWEPLPLLS